MHKIYIIGPVCSGKTTLAKRLSKELSIKHYELDNVVWQYNPNGDIKRNEEEILLMFNDIIKNKQWIIEDVGRKIFKDGLDRADQIIYLNISGYLLRIRILLRWLKQKFKIEKSSYKPDIKMLKNMYKWCINDLRKRKQIIKDLEKYGSKLIILNEKNINKFKI